MGIGRRVNLRLSPDDDANLARLRIHLGHSIRSDAKAIRVAVRDLPRVDRELEKARESNSALLSALRRMLDADRVAVEAGSERDAAADSAAALIARVLADGSFGEDLAEVGEDLAEAGEDLERMRAAEQVLLDSRRD